METSTILVLTGIGLIILAAIAIKSKKGMEKAIGGGIMLIIAGIATKAFM